MVIRLSMSEPCLNVFLKVELLSWVEFFSASSHNLAVSRNNISLIEVIYVVSEGSFIQLGVIRVKL